MPTIDELRTALHARESYAGDPGAVRRALDTRPSRTRYLAPALTMAAVAGVATTAVVLGGGSSTPAAGGSGSRPATPRVASAATSSQPRAGFGLTWNFSVRPVPGYTITRTSYQPDQECADISGASVPHGGNVCAYHPGAFDPAHGGLDGAPLTGRHVTVNGSSGVFVSGPGSPSLYWRYAADSWAYVNGSFGAQTLEQELSIARAVRFGASGAVTVPFRLHDVPSTLALWSVATFGNRQYLGFGIAGRAWDPGSIALSVTRMPDDPAIVAKKWPQEFGARFAVRHLSDGTCLVALAGRGAPVSHQQLVAILNHADVSPDPDKPASWLPVG